MEHAFHGDIVHGFWPVTPGVATAALMMDGPKRCASSARASATFELCVFVPCQWLVVWRAQVRTRARANEDPRLVKWKLC